MKKGQKHIAFSTLLAILVLSVQTVFFPLHYFLTHHNANISLQTQLQNEQGQHIQQQADHPLTNGIDDEGCYWCELFTHQGYFLEKFSDFIFQSGESCIANILTFTYVSLKSELPGSRGPPVFQW